MREGSEARLTLLTALAGRYRQEAAADAPGFAVVDADELFAHAGGQKGEA